VLGCCGCGSLVAHRFACGVLRAAFWDLHAAAVLAALLLLHAAVFGS
jgi:hypothetical protein